MINDILLWKLRLKQIGIIESHTIYNPIIKRPIIFIGKMLKSSYSFEAALTLDWDYDGFPLNLERLYVQNTVSQMIVLINKTREMAYRSTEKKTLTYNAIIKFKLDNPVRIYFIINFLSPMKHFYLNKVFLGQLKNTAAGGKIETKISSRLQANSNSRAYRDGKALLAFELSFNLTPKRCFITYIGNKSDYIDKSLTKDIKLQLSSKKWITIKQKKLLIKYIENCQTHLSVLSINKDSLKRIFYFTELLLNSLLFQVYSVEILSANKSSRSAGIDHKVLKNTPESRLGFLQELKNFRNRKPLPLKRVYIPNKNDEKRLISIPSILDRLVQKLFVLVLDPFIEANSDASSYGFRKGRSPIMTIGDIQKNLQSKIHKGSQSLKSVFIWNADIKKYSDYINHDWLLRNIPFSPKYKYILESWLKLGHITFGTSVRTTNSAEISQGSIVSPFLMNFALNGMEDLIHHEIEKYQKITLKSGLKSSSKKEEALNFFHDLSDGSLKKYTISCRFFRYANSFIIICSSSELLSSIQKTIRNFLEQRGLEIHPNKSKTFLFKLNQAFNFLGYTFIYFTHAKFIRSKLLHKNKLKYKLHNGSKLWVHPSKSAIKSFKSCLKKLIKQNQNISAYRLIALLNPKIKEWINYYSFSNAFRILHLLRKWIYNRITIWMKRKHPKSTIIWLKKHYLLMDNLLEEHDLKNNPKTIEYTLKITSMKQIQQNICNFYGVARKNAKGYNYDIPRINVMLWPNSIKKVCIATAFVPKKNLLACSYFLNPSKWLNERKKLELLYQNKEKK